MHTKKFEPFGPTYALALGGQKETASYRIWRVRLLTHALGNLLDLPAAVNFPS